MTGQFIDAHLHLQDSRFGDSFDEVVGRAKEAGVRRFFCNAISEDDWTVVAAMAAADTDIIPFLGIHPWFSDSVRDGWQQRLLDQAVKCGRAIGIGETGLDRSCAIDFAVQQQLFSAHLELALENGWPVSVHCVRAWGALVEQLTELSNRSGLPRIMIHSFTGSKEIMQRLTRLGCYISYSEALAHPQQSRLCDTFVQTPQELMLLETDAPYAKNPSRSDDSSGDLINEPGDVAELYRYAARLLNQPAEDFSAQIWKNASIFTNQTIAW